jgi:hypothetical protein
VNKLSREAVQEVGTLLNRAKQYLTATLILLFIGMPLAIFTDSFIQDLGILLTITGVFSMIFCFYLAIRTHLKLIEGEKHAK